MIRDESEVSKSITNCQTLNTNKWFESNETNKCFFVEINRMNSRAKLNIAAYYLDTEKNKIDIDLSKRESVLIREEIEKIEARENNSIRTLKH